MKMTMAWAVVLALAVPGTGAAQSVVWSAGPGLFVDVEFSGGNEFGPAIVLGAVVRADRRLAFALDVTLARTDFGVAEDALHRNFASATAALRLMTDGAGAAAFGVTLGAGVLAWDDVSETDLAFRSSADAEQVFVGGVVTRFPVGESWGVSAFARDQVTGVMNQILDPKEGDLAHHWVIGMGVYFR